MELTNSNAMNLDIDNNNYEQNQQQINETEDGISIELPMLPVYDSNADTLQDDLNRTDQEIGVDGNVYVNNTEALSESDQLNMTKELSKKRYLLYLNLYSLMCYYIEGFSAHWVDRIWVGEKVDCCQDSAQVFP